MIKKLLSILLSAGLILQSPVYAATRLDDEGVSQGYINVIDAVGGGITATRSGIVGTLTVAGGAGNGWADDGTVVRLDTSTDNVSIGTATEAGKIFIDGDTDEIQGQFQAHSTQTNPIITLEQSDGTDVFTVSNTGSMGLADGIRQTFNPDATTPGINVGSQAGDPSTPSDGDLWYDSTANELTARINGVNTALGTGGGGSPGGSDTQIQYNDGGSFGGVANFIYDDTNIEVADDQDLAFGSDADWKVQYDEAVDNQLLIATTNTSAVATTDPMLEILVGTTPTADQQVFGVAKGTQASNTPLFTLDEDGDTVVPGTAEAGVLTEGGNAVPNDTDNLSFFAATTSAQLAGVLSDETGTGLAVFATAPTFTTSIAFNAVTDTVAGIQNQNLVDKTAAEEISGVWEVQDDIDFDYGSDADWSFNYDESVDNQLLIETTNTSAVATTDPMLQILVGTTPTADQQVFGVAKGTQASNTDLLTLDEDGDMTVPGTSDAGVLTEGGNAVPNDTDNLGFFAATTSAQLAGVISDETGSGALVFGTSPTIATPTISGAISFPDDVTQTFNPGSTNAGVNVGSQAGDPSSPGNGDMWYDSTANELTARINGANVALGAGGVDPGFTNAADPIVQQDTAKDVHMGDGAGTLTGKVEIGGDADQPQFVIEAHSTQTDDVMIIQNDADTEVFTIGGDGALNTGSIATGFGNIDVGASSLAGGSLDLSEGNATNVGDISLDSLTADDGTTITINDLINVSGKITGTIDDATTNDVTDVLKVVHTTSGTPANNIGTGIEFEAETAASNNEIGVTLEAIAVDTTATSEDFTFSIKQMAAGAAVAETVSVTSVGDMTVAGSGTFGGTDQSTITEGLVVNDGSGGDADDDFTVESDGDTAALQVDASANNVILDVKISIGTVETFTDSDATPDVSGGSYWNTNTSAVTITDFDDGGTSVLRDGDVLTVVSKGAITYDVTSSGIIGGTTDIVTADGDITEFLYDGTDWRVTTRIDQSDDLN